MNDAESCIRDNIRETRLEHIEKIKNLTEKRALKDTKEYSEWFDNFMAIGERVQAMIDRPMSIHPAIYQQLEDDMKTNFEAVRKFWQNPQRKNGPKKYNMKQTIPVPNGDDDRIPNV